MTTIASAQAELVASALREKFVGCEVRVASTGDHLHEETLQLLREWTAVVLDGRRVEMLRMRAVHETDEGATAILMGIVCNLPVVR